jgi:hypothetical protein
LQLFVSAHQCPIGDLHHGIVMLGFSCPFPACGKGVKDALGL